LLETSRFTSPFDDATRTSFAFSESKNSFACTSPQVEKSAAACIVVVPNSGFAIAVLPFHFGSARSRIDFGISSAATSSVFTSSTRARAAKPVQARSAALKPAGICDAAGEAYGSTNPRPIRRNGRTGSPDQKTVGLRGRRFRDQSIEDARALGLLGVEHCAHFDPALLLERAQHRIREDLIHGRINDDLVRRLGPARDRSKSQRGEQSHQSSMTVRSSNQVTASALVHSPILPAPENVWSLASRTFFWSQHTWN
jgi:hypothetical protein